MEVDSRREIAVRVEKVGFTAEAPLLYNFGPNVDINFLVIIYNDDRIMIIMIK